MAVHYEDQGDEFDPRDSTAQADWDDQHRRNQEREAKVTGWKPGASPAPTMTAEQQIRAKALAAAVYRWGASDMEHVKEVAGTDAHEMFWRLVGKFEDYIRGEKC